METNPIAYGLPPRVKLVQLSTSEIGIYKIIKSRIIRNDAEKIASSARQIKSVNPLLDVVLVCTPNICSKSLALLKENGIRVKYEDVF